MTRMTTDIDARLRALVELRAIISRPTMTVTELRGILDIRIDELRYVLEEKR